MDRLVPRSWVEEAVEFAKAAMQEPDTRRADEYRKEIGNIAQGVLKLSIESGELNAWLALVFALDELAEHPHHLVRQNRVLAYYEWSPMTSYRHDPQLHPATWVTGWQDGKDSRITTDSRDLLEKLSHGFGPETIVRLRYHGETPFRAWPFVGPRGPIAILVRTIGLPSTVPLSRATDDNRPDAYLVRPSPARTDFTGGDPREDFLDWLRQELAHGFG